MSCEVYLGDVLCLFQIWMSVSVRDKDIECILKQGNKKKNEEEKDLGWEGFHSCCSAVFPLIVDLAVLPVL